MNESAFYGKKGEDITSDYLRKNGFIIFKRNYHSRFGEIDIVAEKGNLLLFVEVKTRAEKSLVTGVEAVDINKQNRLRLTAADFLRKTHREFQCRFDVSEITVINENGKIKYRLNYIQNAFF